MSPVYHQPKTLVDALAVYAADPSLTVLAGGTDVYPAKASRAGWGHMSHPAVLDISGIPGLRGIEDRGDHWWIGALTTWSELSRAALPPVFDGLKAAAREIGGVQIQNRGTIVGNCCTASPAGDGIPCLLALDAEFEVAGGVMFRIPAAVFFAGYRKTAITGMGELVTAIRIPKRAGRGHFLKLGARKYLVISIVMVSGVFDLDERGLVRSASIAVGACSAIAQRLERLEVSLMGKPLDPRAVMPLHLDHLTPIDDVRASGDYRRAAALQLVRDLIAEAATGNGRAA